MIQYGLSGWVRQRVVACPEPDPVAWEYNSQREAAPVEAVGGVLLGGDSLPQLDPTQPARMVPF